MICTICHHRGRYGRCEAEPMAMKRRSEPDGRFFGPMCETVLAVDGSCGKFRLSNRVSEGTAREVVERIEEAVRR